MAYLQEAQLNTQPILCQTMNTPAKSRLKVASLGVYYLNNDHLWTFHMLRLLVDTDTPVKQGRG